MPMIVLGGFATVRFGIGLIGLRKTSDHFDGFSPAMQKLVGRTLYWAICWFCVLLIVCGVVMPVLLLSLSRLGVDLGHWMPGAQKAQLLSMQVFFPTWVFFVGGCFGSFLNVVAWRVPRGKSILGSSRCPSCDVLLKFPGTNMPILGWLKNGGQCGNCQWPIPVRYFLSELVLGIAFVLLYQLQTVSGGATLPFRVVTYYQYFALAFPPDLLMVLGYHLTLLSVIFTFAVCAAEGFRAPIRVLLFGVAILGICQCCPLAFGIVDFRTEVSNTAAPVDSLLSLLDTPQEFLIASGAGFVAATLCFLLLRLVLLESLHGSFASLLLVGVALGWQSLLSVAVISCVLHLLTRIQFAAAIFCGTLLHLLTWRLQLDWSWWPGPECGLGQMAAAAFSIALLATIIRLGKPRVFVAEEP